ncbi:MAG: DUF2155 domain-containing protein [Erythrobacter sp.]
MQALRIGAAAALLLALGACGEDPPAPKPIETALPEELATPDAPPPSAAEAAGIGSPMNERVATLGLLNKRNNSSQDITLKPGESRRIGDIIVRLEACERTAPWEMQRETGAFVQVLVQARGSQDFRRIFSGWLFKNSPSLNVVEHPVYDVWVKDCAMSFPGEEEAAPASRNSSS